MITLPAEIEDLQLVASVSGGKDSTAMLLALREAGLPHRAVFADTGWEAAETYAYLDLLRARIGIEIDVVGVPGGMRARVLNRAGFPARRQRWCTRELKLKPLRAYHDAIGGETVSVVGIRAQESADRARLTELDDEPARDERGRPRWGGWVWRPLLSWKIGDVLAIHHRHDVPINPLYRLGVDRVGCWPCVNASKDEIRAIAEHDPGRIQEIRELESEVTELRKTRNAEHRAIHGDTVICPECDGVDADACEECMGTGVIPAKRYKHDRATFFLGNSILKYSPPIDEVIGWSRTSRGGRQLPLLAEPPVGGCMRWGFCDPPAKDDE